MDIDLVYMWVDGNDPKWQEKKRIFTGKVSDNSEENNIGRYLSHDELKYSLRSAEKHVPWIRKIFIVTDDQKPEWLDISHPKIQLVDHNEIIPNEVLPCFNASVIEYFLYKIPGLSERFLLANDDTFFNTDVTPDFFYKKDGFPVVRLKRKPLGKWHFRLRAWRGKEKGQYSAMVHQGSLTVEKQFGKFYAGVPHHNIDAYLKADYQKAVEEIFCDQVKKSQSNRIRSVGDMHRSAFSYYALAIGHAHLKYVSRSESIRILIYRHDFLEYINRYKPALFCLNDNQELTQQHRETIDPLLSRLFPVKSSFEK